MTLRRRIHPPPSPALFLPVSVVLVAVWICGCGFRSLTVKINGVETTSPEIVGPARPNTTGRPQLSFCVAKGEISNSFRSRSASVQDDEYYRARFPEYLRRDAPFEALDAAPEGDLDGSGCDVVLSPYLSIYVTPMGTVEPSFGVDAISVSDPPKNLLMALAFHASSIADGGAQVGRVVYNAFFPGTPLYEQIAAGKGADRESFESVAKRYREAPVKPAFPEEARRFKVQAEAAFGRKEFAPAADRYRDALKAAPWWPEGHFNRALIFGETGRYRNAIDEMKKYLTLVPDAPDARAAQDKIYEWEALASPKK